MTPLYRELHRWARTPFVWGECDCMLVLCDWIHAVRGVDPAEDVRGTYRSVGQCQKETGWLRAPVAVTEAFFRAVGIERCDDPKPGDVAVVRRRDTGETIGALWLGAAWACKGPHGTTTLRPEMVEPLAVWDVGYECPR